jgi:hypothetical protein
MHFRYTVEFGVVREGGTIKAFGAGILSSFGELEHMAADCAALEPLDVFKPQPKMSYKVIGLLLYVTRLRQRSCHLPLVPAGHCCLEQTVFSAYFLTALCFD